MLKFEILHVCWSFEVKGKGVSLLAGGNRSRKNPPEFQRLDSIRSTKSSLQSSSNQIPSWDIAWFCVCMCACMRAHWCVSVCMHACALTLFIFTQVLLLQFDLPSSMALNCSPCVVSLKAGWGRGWVGHIHISL